jgi:uncharacterized caspase-like protein
MKRAICIGLNYEGSDYELGGCVNDALANKKRLEEKGIKVDLYTETIGANEFLDALYAMKAVQKSGDTLFITYSGHGTQFDGPEHDGNEGLCFWTGDEIEVLADFDLQKELSLFKGTVVLILDSCFSGGMARALKVDRKKKAKCIQWNPLTMTKIEPRKHKGVVGAKAVTNKRYNLFACSENEVSWDTGVSGLFTASFMKAYDVGPRTIGKIMGKAWNDCSPDQHPTFHIVNGGATKRLF